MPPSDYSNLNFTDRADRRRWKRICEDLRRIAKRWPCYDPEMAVKVSDYNAALGPWRLRFYLAVPPFIRRPQWQGSVLLYEQVGYKQIVIPRGTLAGSKLDMPKDEPLPLKQWDREHWEQAEFILSEVFGDIIRPGDNSQRGVKAKLPTVWVWAIPYEGPHYWAEAQN